MRKDDARIAATLAEMAPVQLSCRIEGCEATWSVASPKLMKKSMDEHRQKQHPDWVEPEQKPMTAYRLDYSGRGRQF